MSKKLLILLSDSPFQHESVDHTVEISRAALRKGHRVSLYLMMDGVYNPVKTQNGGPFKTNSVSERFTELVEEGVEVLVCRVCMGLRGVREDDLPKGIDIGGIFDLSEMMADADVVLSFVGGR